MYLQALVDKQYSDLQAISVWNSIHILYLIFFNLWNHFSLCDIWRYQKIGIIWRWLTDSVYITYAYTCMYMYVHLNSLKIYMYICTYVHYMCMYSPCTWMYDIHVDVHVHDMYSMCLCTKLRVFFKTCTYIYVYTVQYNIIFVVYITVWMLTPRSYSISYTGTTRYRINSSQSTCKFIPCNYENRNDNDKIVLVVIILLCIPEKSPVFRVLPYIIIIYLHRVSLGYAQRYSTLLSW